jgi:hypothetical protein
MGALHARNLCPYKVRLSCSIAPNYRVPRGWFLRGPLGPASKLTRSPAVSRLPALSKVTRRVSSLLALDFLASSIALNRITSIAIARPRPCRCPKENRAPAVDSQESLAQTRLTRSTISEIDGSLQGCPGAGALPRPPPSRSNQRAASGDQPELRAERRATVTSPSCELMAQIICLVSGSEVRSRPLADIQPDV